MSALIHEREDQEAAVHGRTFQMQHVFDAALLCAWKTGA